MSSEKLLVENCLKKNSEAQKELYNLYAPKMYGVCLHFVKNNMEAEDILQEGFIRVFKKLELFEHKGSLEGWIRKIMVNTAINYMKKNNIHYMDVDIDNVDENKQVIVEDKAISNLTEEEILKLVQELPSGKRIVFTLYVYEGYSHKEIAEKLNITVSTSKTQLAKAKALLKDKLEKIQKTVYESAKN